jgi:hypothetical protein
LTQQPKIELCASRENRQHIDRAKLISMKIPTAMLAELSAAMQRCETARAALTI